MTSLAVVVQEEKVSCQERIRKPQKRDWNSKTRKKSKTKKKERNCPSVREVGRSATGGGSQREETRMIDNRPPVKRKE